eukprot:TRINITY_DN10411_c0_g1_i1.p1 TRINITY_DN10411_c0_g1~~TRINITY_DN10411_c0_g1_i1.p1  ORF type:complete len:1009 (-),score=185.49 TRINITY_DN10411_c0_g1_i1:56-3082(-)
MIGTVLNLGLIVLPGLRESLENLNEPWLPILGLNREVGSSVEGLQIRSEPDAHGPSTTSTCSLKIGHIDAINVRSLFAVHFDGHEEIIHHLRHLIILKRLVFHHMAPVAGGVTNREEDGLVLLPRLLERFFPPRVPIDWVVLVLEEVGRLLESQAVRREGSPLLLVLLLFLFLLHDEGRLRKEARVRVRVVGETRAAKGKTRAGEVVRLERESQQMNRALYGPLTRFSTPRLASQRLPFQPHYFASPRLALRSPCLPHHPHPHPRFFSQPTFIMEKEQEQQQHQKQGGSLPTNRLALEKSPYLLQHQHNPVDWYPWGEEAFEKARKENKPIFLSVGYSTCHWCHVMEHESFENDEVAKVMNDLFVSIKVDREERPDVDRIYMAYLQATSGGGGWPMSVWLTPNLKPFHAGTYFPIQSKYGQPGFIQILQALSQAWKNDQTEVENSADHVTKALHRHFGEGAHNEKEDKSEVDFNLDEIFSRYLDIESSQYDAKYGGFSPKPKFPRPCVFTGLFHYYLRGEGEKKQSALAMAEHTLSAMFRGGMHDHLGGGFHRYSVDTYWHVPHFEKMLYDQSQLVNSYLNAFLLSGNSLHSAAATDILEYVLRVLQSPEGGFYSAEDADSYPTHESTKKVEGAFYVWSLGEIEVLLQGRVVADKDGKSVNVATLFAEFYGCEVSGNAPKSSDPHEEFVDLNILIQRTSTQELAKKHSVSEGDLVEALAKARKTLFDTREQRPKPFLDDKIITAWNGLMIGEFARASIVLDDKRYLEAAERATAFIKKELYVGEVLIRNYREGASGIQAFAADYAFLVHGLIDLYQASGNIEHLSWAKSLQDTMNELFFDAERGGFFSTELDAPNILIRMKEEQDNAEPSSNSIAVLNLARLGKLFDSQEYTDMAWKTLRCYRETMTTSPVAFPYMLGALDILIASPRQIVLAGNFDTLRTMQRTVFNQYQPNTLVVYATNEASRLALRSLGLDYISEADMAHNDLPTAYVCQNYACQLPTNDAADLA